ncbi:MAG: type II toxin-antitoxin system VapC family toxin [Candidatus Natronoplasma sp.]
MAYADTDFFLALIKEEDWLKSHAKKVLDEYEGGIWTSIVTVLEISLLCKREDIDIERAMVDLVQIAELKGVETDLVFQAVEYMEKDGLNVFDAFHASFCDDEPMISSDKVFDKVLSERVDL